MEERNVSESLSQNCSLRHMDQWSPKTVGGTEIPISKYFTDYQILKEFFLLMRKKTLVSVTGLANGAVKPSTPQSLFSRHETGCEIEYYRENKTPKHFISIIRNTCLL